MAEPIPVGRKGAVTTLTRNRPDSGNRVATGMRRTFVRLFDRAAETGSTPIVLRANGADICSGSDPAGVAHGGGRPALDVRTRSADPAVRASGDGFRATPVPFVGVVRGRAGGRGGAHAALCDVAIAADPARFHVPETYRDIPPARVMTAFRDRRARHAIGDLIRSRDAIDAVPACAFGIVSKVVPQAAPGDAVATLYERPEASSPASIRMIGEYLNHALAMDRAGATLRRQPDVGGDGIETAGRQFTTCAAAGDRPRTAYAVNGIATAGIPAAWRGGGKLRLDRRPPGRHAGSMGMDRDLKLAVLIDADNTSARYARAIFEEIAKLGQANVRRIYGDFASDRMKGWREVIQPLAIVPQQQFAYTTGKNASDITLVIDAMDLMHRGGLDGFCLVSSDSDFTRLAQRLREDGALVYGIGARKTPESFRNACTRFIYIENLVDGDTEAGEQRTTGSRDGSAKKEPPSKAVPLIRKAMEQAWDDEDWVDLGVVGQRLNHLAPDFDPRTYDCDKLISVVERSGKFVVERLPGRGVRIKRK